MDNSNDSEYFLDLILLIGFRYCSFFEFDLNDSEYLFPAFHYDLDIPVFIAIDQQSCGFIKVKNHIFVNEARMMIGISITPFNIIDSIK